ncbi:hypothetical protein KA183_14700 [bacterium]|nr:hypothetical protein [bacterium]QQR57987.1 MAG: hypothetical protein IPG59_00430 [Candidatus Melainabacteria bacterium]
MTEGQVPNPDFKKTDSKPQVSMDEGNKVNVVKELLCPQLLAALIAGGLFAYTVVKPISVPVKSRGVAPQTSNKEEPKVVVKEDPTLSTDKLLKEIAATEPLKSYEAGKVTAATADAWVIADRKSDRENVRKLMAAGNVLTNTGNIRDAWKGFALLERSQALAPENKWVRLNYARQLFKRGLIKESIQQYEDLLKLTEESDPNWVEPRLELADVYLAEEQTKLAIKLYEDGLKIKHDDPRIIKRIGIAKAVSGDQKKGYDEFIKGCNLEQDKMDYSPDIKADIDKNGGLIESAITDMRKKVAAKSTDIPLRIRLGKLLICVNRLKEAKEHLEEAAKKRESVPEIHEVLSEILYRMGNSEEAFAEFETAARLQPLNKPAYQEPYVPTVEEQIAEEKLNLADEPVEEKPEEPKK